MTMLALRNVEAAPSLAPDDRPIDLVHLARTTLGDRSLERSAQLFDRQSTLLTPACVRLPRGDGDAAHPVVRRAARRAAGARR